MSEVAKVIAGEASESDSEVELGKSMNSSALSSVEAKAFVIAGEASESDEDLEIPIRPLCVEADIVLRDDTMSSPPTTPSKVRHTSILHHKLWECNVSLRATIEYLFKHSTDIAVNKLSRADKSLLSAQESLRSVHTNLSLSSNNLKHINATLKKSSISTALQTVRSG